MAEMLRRNQSRRKMLEWEVLSAFRSAKKSEQARQELLEQHRKLKTPLGCRVTELITLRSLDPLEEAVDLAGQISAALKEEQYFAAAIQAGQTRL